MKFLHIGFIFLVLITLPTVAIAQPGPGPTFNPVPVDGFISLLLVTGGGLGIKHYKKTKEIKGK